MSRIACLLALALLAAPLAAQPLDADAAPRHGIIQAGSGATDDLTFDISPATQHPEADCPGFLDPGAPDAVVEWSGASPMRLWVRSAVDATLTVVGPDGEITCVDDEDGVQPAIRFEQPAPGRYAVWVGAFGQILDASSAATLYAGPPPPPVSPGSGASAAPLPFSGGEDVEMEVTAGGLHPAASLGMPDYCVGFYNTAPSARVSGPTPYSVMATSDADLTLAVRTSGGGWVCNDDVSPFGGTDPAVEIQGQGEQTVWVGTFRGYARGDAPEATLIVTAEAVAPPPPPPPSPVGPREYFFEAEYVSLDLEARGAELALAEGEDEVEMEFELGMGVGNPLSGTSCAGSISRVPTLTLDVAGDSPVTLLASGEDDLVMVVRDAQDQWFCSDDASGRDPAVEVGTGEATIWIGTFGSQDGVRTTFTATRGEIEDVLPEPEEMDFDFDGDPMDEPLAYSLGTYSGDELRGDAQTTLALADGMAEALVFAGGNIFNPIDGDVCTGYITAEPTARFDSGADTLALTAYASFEEDLTLVVQTPSGDWYCSDDYDGTSPGVEVSGGGDGTYTIWVGTFQPLDTPVEAALSVMEGSLDSMQ